MGSTNNTIALQSTKEQFISSMKIQSFTLHGFAVNLSEVLSQTGICRTMLPNAITPASLMEYNGTV